MGFNSGFKGLRYVPSTIFFEVHTATLTGNLSIVNTTTDRVRLTEYKLIF